MNKDYAPSMQDDTISRQAAIDAMSESLKRIFPEHRQIAEKCLNALPSAQSEIIKCKDCKWWDKFDDYDNGYCMAMKHVFLSEYWEISIRRTYKGDFYCADAEPKGEQGCTI